MTQPPFVPMPDHPRATAALGVGLVSVIGAVLVVPAALGPVACYLGISARRAIEREPHRWTGHDRATAGLALGIISTVLLVILAVAAAVFAGLVALALRFDTGYGG
ncbi:MAG: DUF4190 domain-containing protein [Aeromicrobium sp.]